MYRKGPGRVMIKLGGKDETKTNGFTIIEVVLVLAIAGLIFLVVLLALPALQKSQRDSARKQDVGTVIAGLQNYKADNNNQWPIAGWKDDTGYFSNLAQVNTVNNPVYVRDNGLACNTGWKDSGRIGYIVIAIGCQCDTLDTGIVDVLSQKAVVYRWLETGTIYCRDV